MSLFNDDDLASILKQKDDEKKQIDEREKNRRDAISMICQGLLEFPQAAEKVGLEPDEYCKTKVFKIEYLKGWHIFKSAGEYFIIGVDGRCFTGSRGGTNYKTPGRGISIEKVIYYENENINKFAEKLAIHAILRNPTEVKNIFAAILNGKKPHLSEEHGHIVI